jgi:hypothetical protein
MTDPERSCCDTSVKADDTKSVNAPASVRPKAHQKQSDDPKHKVSGRCCCGPKP